MSTASDIIQQLIEDEDMDASILAAVVASLRPAIKDCSIDEDDGTPDALNDDDTLWVVSEHQLMIDGDSVASWTRCSVGAYGMGGARADSWETEEDTNGGDCVPDRVAVVLDALGLEDDLPSVPEPAAADEEIEQDAAGEYAVYWETVGDDAHAVRRYTSTEDAQAVATAMDRNLRGKHGGQLLCGYSVRVLVDGEWQRIDDRRS